MDPNFRIDLPPTTCGPGSIEETGTIAASLGLQTVLIMTDAHVKDLPFMATLTSSLNDAGIDYQIYDQVAVEPTDASLNAAASFASQSNTDGFISLGGGSVIDTTKAADLYSTYPAPFGAYVNAPIGEGRLVPGKLKPQIAIPTTCGTGSEVTGIAVFDYLEMKTKTGIMSRRLVPDHAIIDPNTVTHLPPLILAATALDGLCHALEALTCKPSINRARPKTPDHRPMTQGANPWSDFVAEQAIRNFADNFEQAMAGDAKARGNLLWASMLAGNAFGNAGCHVPHALSYPVSGMVRGYHPKDYPGTAPLVPHGISVVLNAPSTYRLIGAHAPKRHKHAASLLGVDISHILDDEAGEALADRLIELMKLSDFPSGLEEIGYSSKDIPTLTEGALPQRRLLDNAPLNLERPHVEGLFHNAMRYW